MKKKRALIIASLVLIGLIIIGYPMYARKTCFDMADKHPSYTKNGESYLSIETPLNNDTDDTTRTIIKRSEFNSICLQSKFGL